MIPSSSIPFDTLFDPAFLASLSRLRLAARRVARGGRYGERLSADAGAGLEFKDYRPYVAGDDLRAIDWNIYRRLRKVFLRVHDEPRDLPLYLMPDVSASIFLDRPRAVAALRCTLALAAIGMSHHDTAGLFPFADQMEVRLTARSGKASIRTFAAQLARLAPPAGHTRTNLAAAIRRLAAMNLRRGLLVVISDFFDPGGLDAIGEALRAVRHRLLFVQLVRRADAEPELDGDLRLTDCETGEIAELTITPAVLSRYRDAYTRFTRELTDLAARHQAALQRLDVDADLVQQLATLLGTRSPTPLAGLLATPRATPQARPWTSGTPRR